jgi:hypothetical protein
MFRERRCAPEPTAKIVSDKALSRREALALIGASGAALLTGALPARAAAPAAPTAPPSCVARPQQTEGPFFVEEELDRSDIRSDPRSGVVKPGIPLLLTFKVSLRPGRARQGRPLALRRHGPLFRRA